MILDTCIIFPFRQSARSLGTGRCGGAGKRPSAVLAIGRSGHPVVNFINHNHHSPSLVVGVVIVYVLGFRGPNIPFYMTLLVICFPGPSWFYYTHTQGGPRPDGERLWPGERELTEGAHRTLKDIAVLHKFGLP